MNLAALKEFIGILVAFPAFLLWLTVVSLLVRPLGLILPVTPFNWAKHRTALQALTFPQYFVVVGILCFGCGMAIMLTLSGYLQWRFWQGSPLIVEGAVREIVGSLFAGVLFGLISFGGNRST